MDFLIDNNSRGFAMVVSPQSKIFMIDRINERILWSYMIEPENVYDFRRNELCSDYIQADVNDKRQIVLYRHQSGSTSPKVIPWTKDEQMKRFIRASFGYGSEVRSSVKNTICLNTSGKPAGRNETPFFQITKKSFKIFTTGWQLEFSQYQTRFNNGNYDVPVDVYHTYDLNAFNDVCSMMRVRHHNEIDSDLWFYSMTSRSINIDSVIDGRRDVYLGFLGGCKVIVKRFSKNHIFTPTCLKIWKATEVNNIRGLQGAQLRDGAYEVAFDYCDKTLYDFLNKLDTTTVPSDKWFSVFRDIIEGLQYLHRAKICHTNLNPWNILVTSDNVAKICGFTNAKEFSEDLKGSDLTALGKLIVFTHSPQHNIFEEAYEDHTASKITHQHRMYAWAHEAKDISSRLLKRRDNVSLDEVKFHPWLWYSERRIQFLNDANQFLAGKYQYGSVGLQ